MDLKSPEILGSYVDLLVEELDYTGSKEMSSYHLRNIEFLEKKVIEKDRYNKGTYVQCIIILGRRLLSIMVRFWHGGWYGTIGTKKKISSLPQAKLNDIYCY